ncbi:EamA family transporter [Sphingopyxis sp. QXT-31]|uniref:DMT family transporter n=1 Tax=Sphingopyxis sp. QXT-31 TaxID=1357916 RepID=UPI00097962A6|nr:DMT family transporter [Sphingopyxis sp. QXT-31]APZ97192.1 EamA family transporter [Sphingopyxis sp. QXT-31]
MRVRDFLLLVAVCLIWAFNNVLSKIIVSNWAIPPLFYVTMRFAVVAVVMLPWLLPMPRPAWRIVAIALCLGGGSFALLFMGLQTTSPSAAAIVLQLGVPFTMLLSVLMLGERIHWRRGIGIALTLIGVLIVTWRPGFALSHGLWLVAASAFAGAAGAVLMKQVDDVTPFRFQAWVGFVSVVALGLASATVETGQWTAAAAAGWPFAAAVLFTALVVSVGAHSVYYHLIQRYEANLLAPLTLMTPLGTIGLGVLITHDPFDLRMGIGGALAMIGVLIVALRRKPATELLVEREVR